MDKHRKVRTSRMQQYIRELIQEEGLDLDSDSSNNENADEDQPQISKRGRKLIPERWTRIISIHSDDLSKIKTYELAPDLLFDAGMSSISHGRGRPPAYAPLFWPPFIKKQQMNFKTSDNELSSQQLQEYGE